ncbi:MAG: FtsQ-type POTRA domain-containing protein [Desulfobacterales bacterium]|nr:MAG: FtsQ-type POTRA domain-containing protein [Desulfobacterales bacterium]
MFFSKKPRKNYRKSDKTKKRHKILGGITLAFKALASVVALVVVTVFFVLVHDLATKCSYFAARQMSIEGTQRLTPEEVARQARVRIGDNILAVNLPLVRKRLLAHPWIADAEVRREIPSRLIIHVKEHQALAQVDLGQKFLINHQGQIFKAMDSSDPQDLPVVSGLDISDLPVYGQLQSSEKQGMPAHSAPFKAVMQVLQMGLQQGAILPNRLVRQIKVDRQIGLTLYAFDSIKAINLGYSDFPGKYHMLAKLLSYLKRQQNILDFDRIDLNNLERVVIHPLGLE